MGGKAAHKASWKVTIKAGATRTSGTKLLEETEDIRSPGGLTTRCSSLIFCREAFSMQPKESFHTTARSKSRARSRLRPQQTTTPWKSRVRCRASTRQKIDPWPFRLEHRKEDHICNRKLPRLKDHARSVRCLANANLSDVPWCQRNGTRGIVLVHASFSRWRSHASAACEVEAQMYCHATGVRRLTARNLQGISAKGLGD